MKQDLLKIKKNIDERRKIEKIEKWISNQTMWRKSKIHINDDLTVDVDGDFKVESKGNIPIQFGKVTGTFYCCWIELESLKGCPSYVGGFFNCRGNKLTTLEHCPNVEDVIVCEYNDLKTLEHSTKEPKDYEHNPCSYIYDKLGFTTEAHQRCREVFGV